MFIDHVYGIMQPVKLHYIKDIQCLKSKGHKTRSEKDWAVYKATRKVNNLATRLKREYFEASIREAGTDSQKLWKPLKRLSLLPSINQ